jgi:hypothetical protein
MGGALRITDRTSEQPDLHRKSSSLKSWRQTNLRHKIGERLASLETPGGGKNRERSALSARKIGGKTRRGQSLGAEN